MEDEREHAVDELQPGDVEQPDREVDGREQHLTRPKHARTTTGPYHPYTLALLIPGSIFGLLARLGINALVTYPGQSVFALAWVQGVGCFIMGFCLGLRESISEV